MSYRSLYSVFIEVPKILKETLLGTPQGNKLITRKMILSKSWILFNFLKELQKRKHM